MRVGLVGYGAAGRRRRAAIDRNASLAVVGVYDPALTSNGSVDGLPCHTSLDSLLATENLGAVFVCATPAAAAPATLAGLERGLHVFCEKPPAACLADLAPVRAAAQARPAQRLMYGFNHRLHGSVAQARALAESGALGRVVSLRGVYGRSFVAHPPDAWRARPAEAGGGILLDQGIHLLDLARMFAGDFTDVHAFTSRAAHGLAVEDNAWALLRTPGGVVAMLQSSATEWRHRFRLDVTLTHGTLELRGLVTSSGAYAPERLVVRRRGGPGTSVDEAFEFEKDTSWDDEVALFARAAAGETIAHGSLADAWAALELVERIYRAG